MSVGVRFFFHRPLHFPTRLPSGRRSGFYTIMFTVFYYFFIAHGSKFIGRTKATKTFEGRKPRARLLVVGTCWTCPLAKARIKKQTIFGWAAVVRLRAVQSRPSTWIVSSIFTIWSFPSMIRNYLRKRLGGL